MQELPGMIWCKPDIYLPGIVLSVMVKVSFMAVVAMVNVMQETITSPRPVPAAVVLVVWAT
jgi:hypothetical protein